MADRNRRDQAGGPGPAHGPDRPADPESGVPEPVHDLVPHAPARDEAETAHGPDAPRPEREGEDRLTPADARERAAVAVRRPRARRTSLTAGLNAVLPGAGHIAAGSGVRGAGLVLVWGTLLGVAWMGREALLGPPAALDEWVAALTLALALAAVWAFAFRDLEPPEAAGAEAARAAEREAGESQWAIAARHLKGNSLAMAGGVTIVALYLIALLAPLIAPFDPIAQGDIVRDSYLGPHGAHLLGTDQFARDMLSRIIYGARISLSIGFIAVAIAIVLGSLLGAVAGYMGGKLDALLMRFTDMVMAFPRLVLLIMIIALFEPSITLIILVLGLTQWPGTARLVRGEVLSLREQEYVQAARALGFGSSRIILRHLIPNVLAPVIVAATLGIGNTIVLEAGLSFLGLGVQPPTPSWGTLVADGRQNLIGAWWVATFPGLAIVITVLAFNLVGDGLRDALDPRLRS
jgi:peptide/nickel transport system permease protein